MTARGAGPAGAGVALIGMGAAVLLSAPMAPTWPSASPSPVGLWLIDVVSAIPLGEPLHRAAAASAGLAAITAALVTGILVRLGQGPMVAAGSALTVGLVSYGSRPSAADLPASVAAALVTAATAVAFRRERPPLVRASASVAALLAGGLLHPAAFTVLPLVVVQALEGGTIARGLAGLSGVLAVTAWAGGVPAQVAERAGLALARPWLWPVTMIMVSGVVSPLWGRQAPPTAVAGTVMVVALVAVGCQASALAVFPTLLVAAAVASLSVVLGTPARGALVGGLLAVSLAEAWRPPSPTTWPLVAWRDGLERVLPAGTRIVTGSAAAVALNGPLFQGRPSGLAVVRDTRVRASDAGPRYLLEDLAGPDTSREALTRVTVSYANVADFVARLPERTIVGVAIAGADRDDRIDAARTVLASLGHQARPAGAMVAVVGVVGRPPAAGLVRGDGRLHVLIGDPLAADGQRSPTDFELRSTEDGVSVRLRGRTLATGRRWAVIALGPGGPLIEAMADAEGEVPWPVRLPGLGLWRDAP